MPLSSKGGREEMILLISSENKVPNYEVDDAGHHEILFDTEIANFF